MLEMAVIADDLTGAADTGIQFRTLFGETWVVAHDRLAFTAGSGPPRVLAAHTDSRALAPAAAGRRVTAAAAALAAWTPRRVYKKVDSCLRGNIGAEIDALTETLGCDLGFVAPAHPDMGRTTVHDVHRVHGTPVAETEMGRDPATPVTESRLSRVIAAQSRHPVGHVDLAIMGAGSDAAADAVSKLVADGIRHVVFDIETRDHLKLVAGLALERFPSTLLVGSAGLGQGVRDVLAEGADPVDEQRAAAGSGHHLITLGTVSERARRQVEVLGQAYPWEIVDVPPEVLVQAPSERAGSDALERLITVLAEHDVVVRIAAPRRQPEPEAARRIAAGFGAFVAAAVNRRRPATLFMSGGDTALSILDALDATAFRLADEVDTGLVQGAIVGGAVDGLVIGTKPGAFGDDETLLRWRNYWTQSEDSKEGLT